MLLLLNAVSKFANVIRLLDEVAQGIRPETGRINGQSDNGVGEILETTASAQVYEQFVQVVIGSHLVILFHCYHGFIVRDIYQV